jgi:hypothetical protein
VLRSALLTALLAVPHVAQGDDGTKRPTSEPEVHDVDGVGVLAIARHQELFVDGSFAYADGSEAAAIAAGARLRVGQIGFVEGTLPIGWQHQSNAPALGNVMIGGGFLPESGRLVGIALRLAVPTSPSLGTGLATATALAAPRNTDPELWLPHATTAELVADWRWRGDATWVQAEVGLAGWWMLARYETVVRATAAGGVRVAPWLDLTASFVTRSYVLARNPGEEFVHSLVLGIVSYNARGQLAVRLEVPIDASARNDNRYLVGLELRGR